MTMITRTICMLLTVALIVSCKSDVSSTISDQSVKVVPASTVQQTPSSNSNPLVAHLKAPMVDEAYPFDINLRKADDTELKSKDVLNYKDGPTIVSFWLTTCYPCMLEYANIEKKFAKWQEEADFNFVAISTDWPKNHDAFKNMVKKKAWPWESYLDVDRKFWKVMPGALNGLPQVFVYDTDGEIVYYKRKYKPGDEDALFAKIKELQ